MQTLGNRFHLHDAHVRCHPMRCLRIAHCYCNNSIRKYSRFGGSMPDSTRASGLVRHCHRQTWLAKSLHRSGGSSNGGVSGVFDEAKSQMGNPDWLHMFKNSFFRTCSDTGPEGFTELLMSMVEHYFQQQDIETESLIVLLLGSLSDELARHKCNNRSHHYRCHHSSSADVYFTRVANPGHVSLANTLIMMRILLLVQQLATKNGAGPFLLKEVDGGTTQSVESHSTRRRLQQCSKLDKVRILLSDMFIAVIFREAALTANPLILYYSFTAFNTTIEGIFRNTLDKYDDRTSATINLSRNKNSRNVRVSFKSRYIFNPADLVSKTDRHRTTKINNFSTSLKEQVMDTAEDRNSTVIEHEIHPNPKERDFSRKGQMDNISSGEIDLPRNSLAAFMERRHDPQGLYGWGWTDELGVICQGCAALSGLGEGVQRAVFKFGSSIPRIKQMKWNDDLHPLQERIQLTKLESFLADFPDSTNKQLLIALCKAYIMKNEEQTRF